MKARQSLAVGLCFTSFVSISWGQESAILPVRPTAPVIVRPYQTPEVPPVRLANSARLRDLVRGGTLYLTAQDAIALALENNIDIEVARYSPIIAAWNLERFQAGGALPGVPSGAAQVGQVATGQGVAGSQAAAGVSTTGGNLGGAGGGNATISQIGPVTQTLDPTIQESSVFSHTSVPQPNVTQSLVPVLVSATRAHTLAYQQGFVSGGSVSLTYTENYLSENAPGDVLNPSSATNLTLTAQHNLLRGFGVAVGSRNITVAKMNLKTSDLVFKSQVISVVSNVLNAYYALAAGDEDIKAKTTAASVAQKLYDDNKEQVRVGALAPLDLTLAESQLASAQQDLVVSQTNRLQQEVQIKNLLSRRGSADPVIAPVRIVPLDHIVIPEHDQLPPVSEMVKNALANRSDLGTERANLEASRISALGTRNGILPNLVLFGVESQRGLSGVGHTVVTPQGTASADPFVVGGIGKALGQTFRRNFPTNRGGLFFSAPIHNWQAQSDYGIDQIQLRQSELQNQKDFHQVEVDVMNSVVALQQARARYDSAVHNRVLEEKLVDAEQRKYSLGASTPYNVVVQQRDLTNAQASELSALVAYSNARLALEQTLGTILEDNHVSIAEALNGKVARISELPSSLPVQP